MNTSPIIRVARRALRKSTGFVLAASLWCGLETIAQAQSNCLYSLSMTNVMIPSTGGVTNFSVFADSGCAWQALTTNDWIHTSSSGTSTGLVSCTVDFNSSAVARVGRIDVEDQTFVVTQAAPSVTYLIKTSWAPRYGGITSGDGLFAAGSTQTVAAAASSNYTFGGWTEHGTLVSSSAGYTFTLNADRDLVAQFATNVFIPLKGTYNGLFYPTNGITPLNAGSFTLTTTKGRNVSGKMQTGPTKFPFHGKFDTAGHAHMITGSRHNKHWELDLQIDLTPDSDRLTGTLTDGVSTLQLLGDREILGNGTHPSPQAGTYTLVIPADYTSSNTPALEPGGDGYGTVTVNKAGRTQFKATLADGTKVTQSAVLSRHGEWPLYVLMYKGNGLIIGWITFASDSVDDLTGNTAWIKPSTTSSSGYYPAGFLLERLAYGSIYIRPHSGEAVFNFSNGQAVFSGADLGQSITNGFALSKNNGVTPASGSRMSLSLQTSAGTFSGNFWNPVTSKQTKFNGVLLRGRNTGRGTFYGSSRTSGQVRLEAAPPF